MYIDQIEYGDVCTGIGAATVAWAPLGWRSQWFSQYDPEHDYSKGQDFASRVLAHWWPQVPNLGDMLKLKEKREYNERQINLLVGGTPCQGFSRGGLRGGLDDERSNLSLEYCGILDKKQPAWFVWENVPGVLTSTSGGGNDEEAEEYGDGTANDFACLLSEWTGHDIGTQDFEKAGIIEAATDKKYSIAWRVLDSRYFGVPQRRPRIFVVGHIGKDWRTPVAVLFERESLFRDFTPGRKKEEDIAGGPKGILRGSSIKGFRLRGFGYYADDNTAGPIMKRDYKYATDLVVMRSPALAFKERGGKEGGDKGYLGSEECAFTICKVDSQRIFYNTLIRRLTPLESERLQAFPDGHTNIPGATDREMYSALGNSMTVYVMRWIGERIDKVQKILNQLHK